MLREWRRPVQRVVRRPGTDYSLLTPRSLGEKMEVRATKRYITQSPLKVRKVVDTVRGKPVDEALAILRFLPHPVAREIEKLVRSAVANAENNYLLDPDGLYISQIYANEGPRLKRFRPAAHGRVRPIIKRRSQVTVVVDEREES